VHEGDVVTLLVPEDEQGFTLTPEEHARLEAAIAQADRGELIDGGGRTEAPDRARRCIRPGHFTHRP
jgi:hypothetical protein